MILYHAFTTYHLLEFIIHKIRYEKNKSAILLYPEMLFDKYPQIDELEGTVFDKVVQIYESSRQDIQRITNVDSFEEIVAPLNSFEKIYVAGAQNAFAFWLVDKEIPFVFCEEGCGVLSRPEILMNNDLNINVNRYNLALAYGLYTAENKNISSVMCNISAQKKGWNIHPRAKNFNVVEEILKLENRWKEYLASFFKVPVFQKKRGTIVLTQHFANVKRMTYKEQLELYLSTCDYYVNDEKLIFKLHPDDNANYLEVFENIEVVKDKFPSELIVLTNQKINNWKIVTISSRGFDLIAPYFKRGIQFNTDYEKTYVDNLLYYFCAKLVKEKIVCEKIFSYANTCQIENMYRRLNNNEKIKQICEAEQVMDVNLEELFYICDGRRTIKCKQVLDNQCMAIFHINEFTADLLLQEKEDIFVKYVEVFSNERKLINLQPIYFISKNKELRNRIMKFEYEDELKFSHSIVRTGIMNDTKETIALLEAQLSASESLIKQLKKQNTTLIDKIERMESIFSGNIEK